MNKIFRIILVLLLTFQGVPLNLSFKGNSINLGIREAQAAWLSGWTYRKAVTISPVTPEANYQVKVTVSFVSGKMNSDFSDIRFTSSDGETSLDHWRESYTASSTADFWVEVATSGSSTIYMYYGNATAATASSGTNTFPDFFDDASGTYSDKWTDIVKTGNYGTYFGKTAIRLGDGSSAPWPIIRTATFQNSGSFAAEADFYVDDGLLQGGWFQDSTPSTNERYYARFESRAGSYDIIMIDGVGTNSAYQTPTDTWVKWRLIVDGTNFYMYREISSVWTLIDTETNAVYTSGYLTFESSVSTYNYLTNFRVRKYASPEPTTTVGSEELIPTILRDAVIRDAVIR